MIKSQLVTWSNRQVGTFDAHRERLVGEKSKLKCYPKPLLC